MTKEFNRRNQFFVIRYLIIFFLLVSCDKNDYSNDEVPQPLSNVKVENIKGGARIYFDSPNKNVAFIIVKYQNDNGGSETLKLDIETHSTSILINELTAIKRKVELYTLSVNGNYSKSVVVEIEPLPTQNILKPLLNIQIKNIEGGAEIYYDTPTSDIVYIIVRYKTNIGTISTIKFDAKDYPNFITLKGLSSEKRNIELFTSNLNGDYSEKRAVEIEPLEPSMIDVLAFKSSSDDDHKMIQMALDYALERNVKTVYIPEGIYKIDAVGTSISTKGIQMRDGVHLLLHDQAVLEAIPNGEGNYHILKVDGVSNVKISGGKIKGERDYHLGTKGEWGMGISVSASTNVEIKDITIESCWGDGIYIGGKGITPENILIDNVICNNNRRQGISVVNGNKIVISNSLFSNTRGTAPQAGIDLEPNIGQTVNDVDISNCKFINNTGPGLFVCGGAGLISNVYLRNSTFDSNSHAGININGGTPLVEQIKNIQKVTLINNVTTNNPLIGLSINQASNINVDDFQINKIKKNGIRIQNSKSVSIKNFVIESFMTNGVIISKSSSVTLSSGAINANKDSSNGVSIDSSTDINLTSLEVKDGVYGIEMYNTDNSNIKSSIFENQTEHGVLLNETKGIFLKTNSFKKSKKAGLSLLNANENIILHNTFIDNGILKDNTYSQVTFIGVSKNNEFENNTIMKSKEVNKSKYGLFLDTQTSSNIVSNNMINPDSYCVEAIKNIGENNQVISTK